MYIHPLKGRPRNSRRSSPVQSRRNPGCHAMHDKVADDVLYTTVVPRVFMRRVKRVARPFRPCGDHFIMRDVEERSLTAAVPVGSGKHGAGAVASEEEVNTNIANARPGGTVQSHAPANCEPRGYRDGRCVRRHRLVVAVAMKERWANCPSNHLCATLIVNDRSERSDAASEIGQETPQLYLPVEFLLHQSARARHDLSRPN
jgi:hypothetical protein